MTALRDHLLQHRATAALVIAFALLMRVLVPAGFMPVVDHGAITIVLCSGNGPQVMQTTASTMTMAHAGHHPGEEHQGKSDSPCVFSGLTAPAVSGADALLLVVAILFVMLRAVRTPVRLPAAPSLRLRPPLRGPPFLH